MKKYSIPRQIWRALYPILIFLGATFLVSLIAGVVVVFVAVGLDGLESSVDIDYMVSVLAEFELWFMIIANVISIVIFALMWRKIRLNLPKYDNAKLKATTSVLTIFFCLGLSHVIASLFAITGIERYFPSHEEITVFIESGSFLLRILAIGIIAPIVEELLYRGIILNRLLSWMPKWVAILVGSALFGLIHFNLLQGLYAFVVGIVFSVLYLRYRNLWIPIIGHAAFNIASVALTEIVNTTGIEINAWLLLIPSAAISLVCVVLFSKFTKAVVLIPEPTVEASTYLHT